MTTYARAVKILTGGGSFRRPTSLYMYDLTDGTLVDLLSLLPPELAIPLRMSTSGIRSAGTHPSGIVFLSGPATQGNGVNCFAFNGQNFEFIGF